MMLGLTLTLMTVLLGQTPSPHPASAQCVVHVAVNYGPQKNAFLSGVVVGDGLTILTDGGALSQAREITVAYTDGEISDAILLRVRSYQQVGVIPLAEKRGQVAPMAVPRTIPDGEIAAIAGAAPKPFEYAETQVRLRPQPGSSPRRWQVSPALPAFYRGGALLDKDGRLLGILLLESDGQTLTGVALDSVAEMVTVAGAPPAKPPEPVRAEPPKTEAAKPEPPKRVDSGVPSVPAINVPMRMPLSDWTWATVPAPVQTDEVGEVIRACNEMIHDQKYPDAVACFEGALRKHADQSQLHYHAAFAYWYKAMYNPDGKRRSSMERSSYRKAMTEFETFLAKSPDDPRAGDARMRLQLLRSAQYGYRPKSP